MKPSTTFALATLLVTSLAGGSASAQCKPTDYDIALDPTALGLSMGAIATSGTYIAEDCSEMFGVTVSADLPNGELLSVMVVSTAGTFQIGAITMFDGIGQLVLDSNQDASDVFPVNQLKSVQVLKPTPSAPQPPTKLKRRLMPPQILLEGAF